MPITLKDSEGNDVSLPTAEELQEQITATVNTTVTGAVKRNVGELQKALSATIEEAVKAAQPPPQPEPEPEPEPPTPTEDPAVKELQEQLLEMRRAHEALTKENQTTKELAAAEAARAKAERDKARAANLRGNFMDALQGSGISGTHAKHAAAYLLDSQKRAQYESEESDSILFKMDDGTSVPLSDGVSEWAKSDEAKLYLPPSGTRGAGTQPPTASSGNTNLTQLEIADQILLEAMG